MVSWVCPQITSLMHVMSYLCTSHVFFSGLTIHGAVTDDMTVSTLVPIPKGKNMSCTDSSNYRAIALSSVLGKVFDRIFLLF